MENSSLKNVIKNIISRNEKYKSTDELLCACYLYRFLKYNDDKSYKRFKEIFSKLDDEKRYQAINYYLTYEKNSQKEAKRKRK